MDFRIQELSSFIKVGEPATRENLTVFPLFWADTMKTVSYVLLEEAQRQGKVFITEVSEHGQVNTIKFTNRCETAVLILDGEELVGARQNRTVNTTVLVPPMKTIDLPVSCVERGCWNFTSTDFKASDTMIYSTLRMKKARAVNENLRSDIRFSASQHEVWEEIDRKQRAMAAESPTDAVHDVYSQRANDLEKYTKGLHHVEGQAGVAAFVNGRFLCLDLFDRPETISAIWNRLITSYALDALEAKRERQIQPNLEAIWTALGSALVESYPSVGLGTALRIEGQGIVGAGLVDEGALVHLCLFPAAAVQEEHEPPTGRIERPSRRNRPRAYWDE